MSSHVVFDFDGTLVDSLGMFVRVYNGIAERRGFRRMTAESIAEMQALDPRARVRYLDVRWYQLPGLARELKRAWKAELPGLRCFAGVPEMLGDLHARGIGIGIISSNAEENIRAFATRARLPPLQDVRSSGLFGKHRVLAKYLRAHGLRKEQVTYVGDEVRDAQACLGAGVRMVAVTWGADRREHFERCPPAAFADDPTDLLSRLVSLSGARY
jgi:phosphoglycolate phosphatase